MSNRNPFPKMLGVRLFPFTSKPTLGPPTILSNSQTPGFLKVVLIPYSWVRWASPEKNPRSATRPGTAGCRARRRTRPATPSSRDLKDLGLGFPNSPKGPRVSLTFTFWLWSANMLFDLAGVSMCECLLMFGGVPTLPFFAHKDWKAEAPSLESLSFCQFSCLFYCQSNRAAGIVCT